MNREIKFRGKRFDNGEWVFGYVVKCPDGRYRIYLSPFEEATSNTYFYVIPESIGQFTGFKDKNGTEIYEGDRFGQYAMIWSEEKCLFALHFKEQFTEGKWRLASYPVCRREISRSEIIGNIHDNE